MAVQPTIKKTKGKKKPQAGALKQTKTGSIGELFKKIHSNLYQ